MSTLKESRATLILIGLLLAASVWVRTAAKAAGHQASESPVSERAATTPVAAKPYAASGRDHRSSPPLMAAPSDDADLKVTYTTTTATLCASNGAIIDFIATQCPGSVAASTNCPDGTYPTLCSEATLGILPTHCPLCIASTRCPGELAPTNCGSTQASTSCTGSLVPTNCPNGVSSPTNCPNGAVAATMCINTTLVATHCPDRIKPTSCADGIWPTQCPPGNILVPTICPPAANPVICGPTQTLSVGRTPECPTPTSDDR